MESDTLFIRGFNSGYILAKYEPELAEGLASIKQDDFFLSGLQSGRLEYKMEKAKNMLKSNDKRKKDQTPSKGRDKGE